MRFAAALLVAAFAAVALGVALAFAFGGLSAVPAVIALAGGAAAGAFAFRGMQRHTMPPQPIHVAEWLVIAVFALASLRAFLWLLYAKGGDYHILSPNNLGDLPLHMDFIRYLASGVRFWPDSPILSGEKLAYPIGGDFFNSLLLDVGLPLERGLLWVALAASAITCAALWRWGRGFAIAAFLFGGGLAAFVVLKDPGLLFTENPWPDFQAKSTWKNLFLALFVTQRGLLFALPAGLFLLDHWRSRYLRGERGLLPGWAALLLYAAMPLFSVHAFLYLTAALTGMFAFAENAAVRWAAVRFAVIAFLPATLCMALVTAGFSAGGVHLEIGWMQNAEPLSTPPAKPGDPPDVNPWWFWFRNFGLYLVLWAALAIVAAIRGPRETRAIVLPATAMFLVCCFVSFAPWPWDNTKLMLWCWLAVAPCLWQDFLLRLHWASRAAVCCVLFFTGALSLFAGLDRRHDYSLVDLSLVQEADNAVRKLPPEARFACAPTYWHPLIILGRKIAVGYDGHLWSHGLTYNHRNEARIRDFKDLMLGGRRWEEEARKLGIDYIYWGEPEEEAYEDSLKPWEKKLPVVAEGPDFKIYALPPR